MRDAVLLQQFQRRPDPLDRRKCVEAGAAIEVNSRKGKGKGRATAPAPTPAPASVPGTSMGSSTEARTTAGQHLRVAALRRD